MAPESKADLDVLFKVADYRYRQLQMAGIRNIEKNELVDEGYLGYAEAVRTFDPEKSANFESYAAEKVKFAIWQFLRKLDPIDYRVRTELDRFKAGRERYYAEHGKYPNVDQLANILMKTPENVIKLANLLAVDEGIKHAQEIDACVPQSSEMQDIDITILLQDTLNCIEVYKDDTPVVILALRLLKELRAKEIAKLVGTTYSATKITRFIKSARKLLVNCLAGKGWTVLDIEETLQ
ncbi:hypothetical protein JXA02_10860 [candidate division KSB1 bacterium]|nr:hypothetical protein [candidate division KSB1 bacterium]